jgi:hypothetical protein
VAFSYSFIFLEILYFLGRNREERHNEGREGGMGGGREKRKIPVSDVIFLYLHSVPHRGFTAFNWEFTSGPLT